ncbi:hypothetical protein EVG20_g6119 [Dentipellis fragilis]|uniref:DUF6697 domain-containing protein n=1 Tax=Dentipellis fragilis TaxID=205917 RepID=A0A4Y9YQW9_9AGAM|nr:hypothetical protein EVG20_g6119 [Dentipellis fragilis]
MSVRGRADESLEVRNANLEDELRDALRKIKVLEEQSSRGKREYERRIGRMKKDMAGETKTLEDDLKETRRTRNELRVLVGRMEGEVKEAQGEARRWKEKLKASRAEFAKLHARHGAARTVTVAGASAEKAARAVPPVEVKTESPDTPPLKRTRPIDIQPTIVDATVERRSKRQKLDKNAKNDAKTLILSIPAADTPSQRSKASKSCSDQEQSTKKARKKKPSAVASGEIDVAVNPGIRRRLACMEPFVVRLSSVASPLGVSRKFLKDVYGIGDSMFGEIKSETTTRRTAIRHFIFPKPELSQGLPLNPGAPGIMLTNLPDILRCGPISLWMKTKGGLWKYFGYYTFSRSPIPLMADEARALDEWTRKAWVNLLTRNEYDSHAELRMRIWFRKIGAEVSKDAIAQQLDLLQKGRSPMNLSKSDISDALQSWQETLHVVMMHCVGYEYNYLADVEDRWREWYPQATASRA